MSDKIEKSEQAWRCELTPEQFQVCRQCGTEPPFSGANTGRRKLPGCTAVCAAVQPLFRSETKFDSGSGWPSFFRPHADAALSRTDRPDNAHGMRARVEVRCARCDSHLGHVFPDGPTADRAALLRELSVAFP
jgi:peptide-methionine (R)-S-oxide reductase